jgi:hypothetical protein
MTTPKVESIGLIAHYSDQGDWAFEAALGMARKRPARLNVFHFLESPYDVPVDRTPASIPVREYDDSFLVRKDRELRERWEDRLGDFVEIGYRVCDNVRHNLELRRCLMKKEYQILIVPYTSADATFGNLPIEEFAFRYTAPMMLVGPESPGQCVLNPPAVLLTRSGDPLITGEWRAVPKPRQLHTAPVI